MGRIIIGIERLKCPRCKRTNVFEIRSDLPERGWRECGACGYRAIMNFVPILDKYGIPHGASRIEKREIGEYLQRETAKI